MRFSQLVEQVRVWLQRQGRVSYRALKREFDLDDESLADLKAELIDAQRVARDEDGKVLVWAGENSPESKSDHERLVHSRCHPECNEGSLGGIPRFTAQKHTLRP
ncbi:MAG: hypothetical protein FJ147_26075, partial [Deltaproteobacteria bacterium]|nr:hypothetical protein [Deltaproteobacteria bacterium]